jgi:glycosyltransferase involved in cell wall biosynthesis
VRLLFVIDSLGVGGAERSLLDIIPRLAASATVLRLSDPDDLDEEFARAGVPVVEGALPKRAPPWVAARLVGRAVAVLRPDIVHSTLFRSDIAVRLAPISVPIVSSLVNDSYSSHRYEGLSLRDRFKLDAVRLLDAATARRPRIFIANSDAIARTNAAALHIPARRIRTIYRGRDLTRFRPPHEPERERMRARLGVSADFVVMTVGRLLARKGHAELLDACARARAFVSNLRLLVVGDGPERAQLEARREELGLLDVITFLGTRHDVDELLWAADVFAFPSHYEGFPGALVEAMASGIPIVASDIDMHREAVEQNVSGRLVPLRSADALAEAIVDLARDPRLRVELGAAARRTARQRFDVEQVAKAYDAIYAEICDTLGRSP